MKCTSIKLVPSNIVRNIRTSFKPVFIYTNMLNSIISCLYYFNQFSINTLSETLRSSKRLSLCADSDQVPNIRVFLGNFYNHSILVDLSKEILNKKKMYTLTRPNRAMLNFNVATMLNFNVVSMLRHCGKAITKLFMK